MVELFEKNAIDFYFKDLAKTGYLDYMSLDMVTELSRLNIPLVYLQSNKKHIALLSNKPEEFCKLMVKHYFPEINFSVVKGNVDHIPPKPDPAGGKVILKQLGMEPSDILFVGDSNIDMQTAKNCSFTGIGAEWGFRTKEELDDAGANITFKTPKD